MLRSSVIPRMCSTSPAKRSVFLPRRKSKSETFQESSLVPEISVASLTGAF